MLGWLTGLRALFDYILVGRRFDITLVKLVVGVLVVFAALEVLSRFKNLGFDPRYLPLGGAISGFFGGLSGMQGRCGRPFWPEPGCRRRRSSARRLSFPTSCLVDVSGLALYSGSILGNSATIDHGLLAAAVLAAFAGALLGNFYLKKITMRGIQRIVATMLFAVAIGLITGLL